MALTIPNLSFSNLNIKTVIDGAWPAQEASINGARTPAAKGPLTAAAVKVLYKAITDTMTVYEREESAYLDTVERLHAECKLFTQEVIGHLARCKDIKPDNPLRTKLFQGSIDFMQGKLTDVSAAVAAIKTWRNALTGHQGVRSNMAVPPTMKDLLGDKFVNVLLDQYNGKREPFISRMAKEGDSVTKIFQFEERISDCLKAAKSMYKASGQDAVELDKNWKELKDMADNWQNVIKFPTENQMTGNLTMLKKNDPKDKAGIEMLAKKTSPAWIAQIKGTRSYIKTVTVKRDNFISSNADVKKHPVYGKQLEALTKQLAMMEKEVATSADLVDQCLAQFKKLKV